MATFGVSSYLFREARLDWEHLVHVTAHGFDALKVLVEPTHFDHLDASSVKVLSEWVDETRLSLQAWRVPNGQYVSPSADDILAVLDLTDGLPYRYLTVQPEASGRLDARGSARLKPDRWSLERIASRAREVGVQLALTLTPDTLSAAALGQLVDEGLEGFDLGVCLDFGHAHLIGDLPDVVEVLSGHVVVTTHVHDNRGRRDEHLVPFAGMIDWDTVLIATQTVGYDGITVDTLRRCEATRARLEQRFITF